MKKMEKSEYVLLKIYVVGGSVMYIPAKWECAQSAMKEFKYFLRWKYTERTKENDERLIEESEFKRPPFVNYFLQRDDGGFDGVIDFCSISGINHSEIPVEEEKETPYVKAMIQLATDQSKLMKKFIKDISEGDEWKEKGECPPKES